MKHKAAKLIISIAILIFIFSCGTFSEHSDNKSISGTSLVSLMLVDNEDFSIRKGDALPLIIQGVYSDGSIKILNNNQMTYYVNDPNIVSVNSYGEVKALKAGNTTLKISLNNLTPLKIEISVLNEINLSNLNPAYFGYMYISNIPKNSLKDKYDERAFAMISGKALDIDLNPVKDVKISIKGHKEYGSTLTDKNGSFAIPVEGGEELIVRFQKEGYASIDRKIYVNAQDWNITPDITLLQKDKLSTVVNLNSSKPQIHLSSKIRDDRGERQSAIVFEGRTKAKVVNSKGEMRDIETLQVRSTEFQTPKSMPSSLPDASAFTYCTDISVDGLNDDESIEFEKPLTLYVDNFLGFNVGEIVPVGYYDRNEAQWIGSKNGVVVRLLDMNGDGKVDALDYTGDGLPDDLERSGNYEDSVSGIKDNPNFKAGQTYWRASIEHFTPWDLNYPYVPVTPVVEPSNTNTKASSPTPNEPGDCKQSTNSYITSKTKEMHEEISLSGSDIKLHYSSRDTVGYKHVISFSIDTSDLPPSASKAEAILEIAGSRHTWELKPNRLNNIEFFWDGKDVLGNEISGITEAKLITRYYYNLMYLYACAAPMSSSSSIRAAASCSSSVSFQDAANAWAQVGNKPTGTYGSNEAIYYDVVSKISVVMREGNSNKANIANGWSIDDGLYMNLNPKGVLSGIKGLKYIEAKDDLLFAVDTEPKDRFTVSRLLKNVYYSLAIKFPSAALSSPDNILSVAAFGIADKKLFEVERTAIGRFSQFDFRTYGNNPPPKGYDPYAYYKGTIYEGAHEQYLGASLTAEELKQKIKDMLQNNEPFIFATNDDYGNLNRSGNYWVYLYPTEFLYSQINAVYPSYYDKNLHLIPSFSSLDLNEDNIVIFNDTLGYVYDLNSGLLVKIFDNTQKKIIRMYGYDDKQNLISITDQFGNVFTIHRDYEGKPYMITSPNSQTTRLFINRKNDLASVTYEDSSGYRFEYDENSLLTSKNTPNNYYSRYYYDSYGRVARQLDTNGGEWSFAEQKQLNSTEFSVIKPMGDKTTYTDFKTLNGSLFSTIKLPSGYSYTYSSDKENINSVLSKDGVLTTTKTSKDPLTQSTALLSQTISLPSSLSKSITQSVSYNGNMKQLSSKTTSYTINGKTTKTIEDYVQGVKSITSPLGKTSKFTYDKEKSLLTKIELPSLLPVVYEYDDKGRLIKQSQGETSSSYSYDNRGNLRTLTSPKGLVTSFEYDILDRVTRKTYPNSNVELFSYDKEGNMLRYVTPKSSSFDFTFNPLSQRTSFKSPSSKSILYSYNKNRDLTSISYPSSKTVEYIYKDSLLSKVMTNEEIYSYSYSFHNKLQSITSSSLQNTLFSYDGHLLKSIEYSGSLNQKIEFNYNSDFLPSSITYLGKTDYLTYDSDNELTKSGTFNIQRDKELGFANKVYDDKFIKEFSYDNKGYISKIKDNSYSEEIRSRYTDTNIKEIIESIKNKTVSYVYEYDELNRLVKVIKNNITEEEYFYDKQGNRIKAVVNNKEMTGVYNSDDELSIYGGYSYSYDRDGRLNSKTTNKGTIYYTYGTLGELREVILEDGTKISYLYNANNQRVEKRINSVIEEKYLWLNLTTLLGFYDKEGNEGRFTYTDSPFPVMLEYKNQTYYLSYNHLGSLRVVSDKENNIVKEIEYDSFGNILRDTNEALHIPLGFAGGLYDKDTKLTRFGYRDYDSTTGRWTSKDPIDFQGGDSNLYGYVLNNPVNLVDPEGEMPLAGWIIAGAGAGAVTNFVMSIINGNSVPEALKSAVVGAVGGAAAMSFATLGTGFAQAAGLISDLAWNMGMGWKAAGKFEFPTQKQKQDREKAFEFINDGSRGGNGGNNGNGGNGGVCE